ncbi:Probable RNA-directed DNA polymerase from transposon BS [Eumeta japonica]|uniref:Probable RNA-directed DNA polymerase from transposon BS n=1 Tax=Eumeta variegata TaxID=151549 RepID=A0A4C1XSQ6_EUMVA|nr:Probable RNA-directed DNA polymerase from transposon BS [Eumeta japonica]
MNVKQFGFTKGRSTTEAGVELIQQIFGAWEDSRDAIGVFCDLSKAFDCVHHDTLIRKLYYYGVTDRSLGLLESYLSDRIQRVDINDERSSRSAVNMGVPQGSVLGPFLFLVYINDLPHFVKNGHGIVLFADDTSLLFKINKHKSAFDEVNSTISEIVEWFSINNLLLNERKTKLVKFFLSDSKLIDTNVMVKNEVLDIVDTTLFLGLTLDSKLRWNSHITRLAKRLSSAAHAVKRIRRLTNESTARLVYFSCFLVL